MDYVLLGYLLVHKIMIELIACKELATYVVLVTFVQKKVYQVASYVYSKYCLNSNKIWP